jgi:hypothetical protein
MARIDPAGDGDDAQYRRVIAVAGNDVHRMIPSITRYRATA